MTPCFYSAYDYAEKYNPLISQADRQSYLEHQHFHIMHSDVNFVLDRMSHNPNPMYRMGALDKAIAREVAPFVMMGSEAGIKTFMSFYNVLGIDGLPVGMDPYEIQMRAKSIIDACTTDAEHESLASEVVFAAHKRGYRTLSVIVDAYHDCGKVVVDKQAIYNIITDLAVGKPFRSDKKSVLYEEIIRPEIEIAIDAIFARDDGKDIPGEDTVVGSLLRVKNAGGNVMEWIFEQFKN